MVEVMVGMVLVVDMKEVMAVEEAVAAVEEEVAAVEEEVTVVTTKLNGQLHR